MYLPLCCSVILEEKSNMSVSSVGPSPSVVYNTGNREKVQFNHDPRKNILSYVSVVYILGPEG